MNKITAVIIEDEIPAARRLNNTLNELRPEWQITVLPGSVKKSVEWFAENPHPDLVFLDIQLTDGISFTFIEQAQPESTIIFTTAYDEYAIRAFTVNSIDYLLKPIDNIRLEEAIVKFEHLTTKYLNQGQKPIDLMEILQNKSIFNDERNYFYEIKKYSGSSGCNSGEPLCGAGATDKERTLGGGFCEKAASSY